MLDLTRTSSGQFGAGFFFSDVFGAALAQSLTGTITIEVQSGDARAYFSRGMPVGARGSALVNDLLGQAVVGLGLCSAEAVEAALALQAGQPEPLGAILKAQGAVDADGVDHALRYQIARRFTRLFGLVAGPWSVSPELPPEIVRLGVETDGHGLFLPALRTFASDDELRHFADQLLGRAVQLRSTPGALARMKPEPNEAKVFELIEKPRKLEHLERAVKNRRDVRIALRALMALGYVEVLPAAKALAVASHVPLPHKGTSPGVTPIPRLESKPKAAAAPAAKAVEKKVENPVVKELKEIYGRISELDYFELLGLARDADDKQIRLNYGQLAKKFHPDTFGQDLSEEISAMARTVISKLNEAYAMVGKEASRREYIALLNAGNTQITEDRETRKNLAKLRYEMGTVMLKKKDFKQARELLKVAVKNDPQAALYKGTLGWAYFADPDCPREEALLESQRLVSEALGHDQKICELHYYQGSIAKERGDPNQALASFRRANQLDPNHKGAASELRLLERRAQKNETLASKAEGLGGKLNKLFKR